MSGIHGKVIAITGGASGIGFATAKLLASKGARISIGDLHPNLDNVVNEIGNATGNGEIFAREVDVRDTESVASWIEATVQRFGQLNGAANIAGVFKAFDDRTVAEEDEGNWKFMLDVNLTGLMHCMRAEIPHMVNTGGSIVNAASILSTRGWQGAAAYSASKHGVVGLTKSAAREIGGKGVRVNCVAPYVCDLDFALAGTTCSQI